MSDRSDDMHKAARLIAEAMALLFSRAPSLSRRLATIYNDLGLEMAAEARSDALDAKREKRRS